MSTKIPGQSVHVSYRLPEPGDDNLALGENLHHRCGLLNRRPQERKQNNPSNSKRTYGVSQEFSEYLYYRSAISLICTRESYLLDGPSSISHVQRLPTRRRACLRCTKPLA